MDQQVWTDLFNAGRCPVGCKGAFSTSELKALLRLCLPVALATICRLSIFSTDSVFVGNLPNGTDALGGLTTASNVLTICGQTFVFSYGYVLNSICAQAIGAGNPKLAGGWLQVSLVSVTVLTIPVLVCYFLFTKPLLELISGGQSPVLVEYGREFSIYSLLCFYPMVLYMTVSNE